MAVLNYTGWASNVNKIIIDSSTISVGENALRNDELENGHRRTRARSTYVPDTYSVVMDFDWEKLGSDGKSEYQRFIEWYKYQHKYGSVPFEFPSILYSASNGINVYGTHSEYYKITSAIEGSKFGSSIRVKMTWTTVYGGVVSIAQEENVFSNIENLKSNSCDVIFSSVGSVEPVSQTFTVTVNGVEVDITSFIFNGNKGRIFFDSIGLGSTVAVSYKGITRSAVYGG